MNSTAPISSRYPTLLRWSQAMRLAVELGVTANCFRTMTETGVIQGIAPTGKRKFYRRDDIIQRLS